MFVDWKVDCQDKAACVAHLDRPGVQILVGRTKVETPVRMAFRISAAATRGDPVTVRLDDGWQAALRVDNCSDRYCEVGVAKTATTIAVTALARNSTGVIAYRAKDRIFVIPISLKGFGDAMGIVGK